MSDSPDPDTLLFLRVRTGDRAAFDEIMRRFEGRVLGLVRRTLGASGAAEDVAQEVFLKIFEARKSFEPRAKFSTWLYRVTVNLCLNEIRGRGVEKRRLGPALPSTAPRGSGGEDRPAREIADVRSESPDAAASRSEIESEVRRAIAALPEAQRVALVLNRYEELSYEDLGHVLEMSVAAVKSLLFRARENVRKALAPLGGVAGSGRVREASP